jgi:CPA2 family monovalent cation:H+ antiporter-2
MSLALQLSVLLAVGLPLAAITQPFVPLGVGLVVLAIVLVPTTMYLWRSTAELHAHVRSATLALIEVLRRGASRDDEPVLDDLLHGLGDAAPIRLPADAPAVGKTLAQLDLRVATGATVLAIARAGADVTAPTGHEALRAGDTLAVAGPQDAVRRARALLLGPTPDEENVGR